MTPAEHAASVRECLLRRGAGDYERTALDSLAALLALAERATDPDYSPAYQDEYQRLWHQAAARAEQLETALRPYLEQHAKAWRDDQRAGECICVMCDAARAALDGGTE